MPLMRLPLFFAYLDPGSGSLILQMMLGGIAAGLYMVKSYWQKIKSYFTGKTNKSDPPAPKA